MGLVLFTTSIAGILLFLLFGLHLRQLKFWFVLAIYMFIVVNGITTYNNYWEASAKVTNYELLDLAQAIDKYQRLTASDITELEDLFEALPQRDGTHPFIRNERWQKTGCVADVWGVPYIYDREMKTVKSMGAKWHFLKPRWYQDTYTQELPQY